MATKLSSIAGSPRMSAEEKSWRAQDDLRTLQQAAKIQADAARVKAAQAEAQSQIKALVQVSKKK